MKYARVFLAGLLLVCAASRGRALDAVKFATNWRAEAEHGGFYQALVDGTYERYGLDVKIIQGGPQVNNQLLLAAGRVEFYLGANMIQALHAVEQGIPTLVVASLFQKDPLILMSHPGIGLDRFEDLPNATAYIGKDNLVSVYQWLKNAYGFREEKVKPYNFNAAPFIADKNSIQQGYVTSEPYAVERQGGFEPNIFLLADYGYDSYSTTIETRIELAARNPDLVQRFVDASILGWYNYLSGDNTKANARIKQDNPEMTDDQLAFSVAKLKEYGIVDSGDSRALGIGAMTNERMKSFFGKMVAAQVIAPNTDYKRAYSLAFVNKKIGLASGSALSPRPASNR